MGRSPSRESNAAEPSSPEEPDHPDPVLETFLIQRSSEPNQRVLFDPTDADEAEGTRWLRAHEADYVRLDTMR